jgi:transcriptional regulator with XRE-family HTH domain
VFAEELKRLRLKAGLTQEEVAARAKVTREYVSMLEAKKYSPTIEVFIRLCRAVEVAPADVIATVERMIEGLKR